MSDMMSLVATIALVGCVMLLAIAAAVFAMSPRRWALPFAIVCMAACVVGLAVLVTVVLPA